MKGVALGSLVAVEVVRIIGCLPVRVLPGVTPLEEVLPPALVPAKQEGAIASTAVSNAAKAKRLMSSGL